MTKNKCRKLYDKIAGAYYRASGGDYHDTMYYQWLGASEEMQEAEINGDWEYAYKTLLDCWKYVEHCEKIDDLQQNMPRQVYG